MTLIPSPQLSSPQLPDHSAITPVADPQDWTIAQYFEQQVAQTPQALALIAGDQRFTYAELNARANQLAHYLQNLGVLPQELVAVSIDRSVELIVAFLGILKAGAAYVPLDPSYPHDRRAYKLRDAQVSLILTNNALVTTLPQHEARVVRLDSDWPTIARESTANLPNCTSPDGLAYVLYTSGSTGNPKGVMIQHRGMVNHAAAIAREFALKPGDRMLQFSNIGFDIFVEEMYPTLVSGAALVLRPEAIAASTQAFWQFVTDQEITILDLPTAFWHELVDSLERLDRVVPAAVRLVCVGGEKASCQAYQQWQARAPHARWINTYGPTEITVSATWFDPVKEGFDSTWGEIPIGKPLPNVEVYVLDEQQHPLPIGQVGELCIGGPGLARGYLNMPDRTAAKFIAHPSRPGDRLYRTGDQVRFRPDGHLEFIGRIDFQVKIRGFRIELGEVEAQLAKHPTIRQVVVLAQERAGSKYLVAYVVPYVGSVLDPKGLTHWAPDILPNYMIPRQWVILASLPLTPNGKVDRNALSSLAPIDRAAATDSEPPQDALERQLLQLWEEVLGQSIGVHDNFFELGGHSLLVARLCDRVEQQLQRGLSPMVLFQAPTVRQLSQYLRQEQPLDLGDLGASSAVVIQAGAATRPPLFAIHVLGEGGRFFRPLAQHLGLEQSVYGLAVQMLDPENAPPNRVEDLAAYYIREIQTLQPQGPYYLVGMSYGGTIAYEIARQMEQLGLTVGMVALLDTYGPEVTEFLSHDRLRAHWQSFQQRGFEYLQTKLRHLWQTWFEQVQVRYGRLAQTLGWQVSYELRYKMILADNQLADAAYVPKYYPGRLSLFRATENVFYSQNYLAAGLGWRDRVSAVTVYDVSGSHMTMVEEPHAAVLAVQMQQAMQLSDRSAPGASAASAPRVGAGTNPAAVADGRR